MNLNTSDCKKIAIAFIVAAMLAIVRGPLPNHWFYTI